MDNDTRIPLDGFLLSLEVMCNQTVEHIRPDYTGYVFDTREELRQGILDLVRAARSRGLRA